jgi:hypothetical protein
MELVIPDIWRCVCLHLFALTTGIGFTNADELWENFGAKSGFSVYLASDILMVSDRVKVDYLPWGKGIDTQFWDIHDVMSPEDQLMSEILCD